MGERRHLDLSRDELHAVAKARGLDGMWHIPQRKTPEEARRLLCALKERTGVPEHGTPLWRAMKKISKVALVEWGEL